MKKSPRLGGAGSGTESQENNRRLIATSVPASQQPLKPHVRRAIAPPLHQYYSSNTVTAIIELVALHLRRAIPALSSLTLTDFDVALAGLYPQIRELIDVEIREALGEELVTREMEREELP